MSDDLAAKYHAWAALARKDGDTARAGWLDEQADYHERLAESIARLEHRCRWFPLMFGERECLDCGRVEL